MTKPNDEQELSCLVVLSAISATCLVRNAAMPVQEDQTGPGIEFCHRLKLSLLDNNLSIRPASVARGFNLRAGTAPVTAHAVRKWLIGTSTPAGERMAILAQWLNVSAGWLRYGGDKGTGNLPVEGVVKLALSQAELMRAIAALSAPSQIVIRDVVEALRRLEVELLPPRPRQRS